MKGLKAKRERSEIIFIASGLNLVRQTIPLLALYTYRGDLKVIGTSKVSEWFERLDEDKKEDLKNSITSDIANISSNTEPLLSYPESMSDRDRTASISRVLDVNCRQSALPLLPFPLSLMNKRQKIKYLSEYMANEANSRRPVKFSYGAE